MSDSSNTKNIGTNLRTKLGIFLANFLGKEIEEGEIMPYTKRKSYTLPAEKKRVRKLRGLCDVVELKINSRPRVGKGIFLSFGDPCVFRNLIPANELRLESDKTEHFDKEMRGVDLKMLYDIYIVGTPENSAREKIANETEIPSSLGEKWEEGQQKMLGLRTKTEYHKPINWIEEAEKTTIIEISKLAKKARKNKFQKVIQDTEPGIEIFNPASRTVLFGDPKFVKDYLKENEKPISENNGKNVADAIRTASEKHGLDSRIIVLCDDTLKGASLEEISKELDSPAYFTMQNSYNPYETACEPVEKIEKQRKISRNLFKVAAIVGIAGLIYGGYNLVGKRKHTAVTNTDSYSSTQFAQETPEIRKTTEKKKQTHKNYSNKNEEPKVTIVDFYPDRNKTLLKFNAHDKRGITSMHAYIIINPGKKKGEKQFLLDKKYNGDKEVKEEREIKTSNLDPGKYFIEAYTMDKQGEKGEGSFWLGVHK